MILVENMLHVPRNFSLPRKYYPSFAWPRCISETDVYVSWCTCDALANRRGENLAITFAQCRWTQGVRWSSTSEDSGIKQFCSRQIAPELSHLQSHVCTRHKGIENPTLKHTCSDCTESHGGLEQIPSL